MGVVVMVFEIGDCVLLYFIVICLLMGIVGLFVVVFFLVVVSSVDMSFNSLVIVVLEDFWCFYVEVELVESKSFFLLCGGIFVMGMVGMVMVLVMIFVRGLFDVWWMFFGIFVGGVLGLFLFGLVLCYVECVVVLIVMVFGVVVIFWMMFLLCFDGEFGWLCSFFYSNFIIVFGMLMIFFCGFLFIGCKFLWS